MLGLAASIVQLGCGSSRTEGGEPLKPGASGAAKVEGIEYRGELLVMESFPVQLAANVTVTNTSKQPATLEFPDGCVVLLRAYRAGEQVWDQSAEMACTMAIQSVTLGAGESKTFRAGTDAYEILGDALPDGSYRMTAYLRPDGRVVELELGSTDLAIPRAGQEI